jgi:hypothetical protein
MKAFCSLLLLLGASGAAVADEPRWYMAGHLGANTLDDWSATVEFGGV